MILLSLLCVIALQYYRPNWRFSLKIWRGYRDWLLTTAKSFVDQSKLTRAVVLVLPLWLVSVILFSIIQAIFGPVSSFLLDVLIAWSVLDVRMLFVKEQTGSIRELLVQVIFGIFTPLFWFTLLGWPALLLYLILWRCHQTDKELAYCDEGAEMVHRLRHQPVSIMLSLLAWIPVRLAMLSCAVVGNFSVICKVIQNFFAGGISLSVKPLVDCFCPDTDMEQAATQDQRHTLLYMLGLWLAVILVFLLGAWLG